MSAREGTAERSSTPAKVELAPAALDLRLLPPALTAWLTAFLLLAQALDVGQRLGWGCAVVGLLVAGGLLPSLLRYRPPRHRLDPRPGAQDSVGTVTSVIFLSALAMSAVSLVTVAGLQARQADPLSAAVVQGEAVTLIGTVTSSPRPSTTSWGSESWTLALAVEAVDGEESRASALVFGGQAWSELQLGDRVRLHALPRASENGSRYGAFLNGGQPRLLDTGGGVLGVVTQIRAGLVQAVGREPANDSDSSAGGTQGTLLPEGAYALVPGVALGDDAALPAQVREDMRAVSLTHLTAVSGQHVAIVLGLVLSSLGALPRRWRAGLAALVLLGMVVLVRPGGSVVRAATMGGVLLVAVALGRRSVALPALHTTVILLLLLDPWQARDVGFGLSVAATAGILLWERPVRVWLSRRLPRWLSTAVALPLVAQLACAPLLVLLQPRVGLWAIPANILAAPPVPVATVCGLLAALLAPLWPSGAHLLALPALWSCAWLAWVAGFFAGLPGAILPWPAGAGGAVLLAGLELALIGWLRLRRRRRLPRRRRRHGSWRGRNSPSEKICAFMSAVHGRL